MIELTTLQFALITFLSGFIGAAVNAFIEYLHRRNRKMKGLPKGNQGHPVVKAYEWKKYLKKYEERLEEIAQKGLDNAHTIDFTEQAENSKKILAKRDASKCEEVDLEKEIDKTVNECTDGYNFDWDRFALHFYELGKQAKKEE